MKTRNHPPVLPLLMLGVLLMILAVLAFERAGREDGHLPEQNGHGRGGVAAAATTVSSGNLVPLVWTDDGAAGSRAGYLLSLVPEDMRCPPAT